MTYPVDQEAEAAREEQRQQRDFEMLKHMSTLDVAALVLLLALVRDFSPARIRTDPPILTLVTLLLFFASLLCAIGGLFLNVAQGRDAAPSVRILTGLAYLAFLGALVMAFVVGYTTL